MRTPILSPSLHTPSTSVSHFLHIFKTFGTVLWGMTGLSAEDMLQADRGESPTSWPYFLRGMISSQSSDIKTQSVFRNAVVFWSRQDAQN